MELTKLNNETNPELQKQQQSKPKNKRNIIIWIIVTLVIIAIAIGFAYSYGGYKQRVEDSLSRTEQTYLVDSVEVDGWASPQDYETWKGATFTIPQYDAIPVPFQRAIVKIFMDNDYFSKESTDNHYFFTKIKDRAYRVISYGDFTGQGDHEMAFLLEKSDFASSAIYIIPQKGNILYWKALNNELPTIKSFKKGALIFMGDTSLVAAPSDGIFKQTKESKYVLIYNHQTKTFDEYYQYTNEDIKNARNSEDGDEEGEAEEADSTAVVQ